MKRCPECNEEMEERLDLKLWTCPNCYYDEEMTEEEYRIGYYDAHEDELKRLER